MEDSSLGDIVQKLDYDRFHVLYVLNGDMEIIGQITEQQVVKALQTCSANDRICDVFFLGM
jgi:stage IV sporulation protein FB